MDDEYFTTITWDEKVEKIGSDLNKKKQILINKIYKFISFSSLCIEN